MMEIPVTHKAPTIEIDHEKCTVPFLCKKCLQAYPQAVLTVHNVTSKEEKLKEMDPRIDGNYTIGAGRWDKCNVCNKCIDVCPVDAITIEYTIPERADKKPASL